MSCFLEYTGSIPPAQAAKEELHSNESFPGNRKKILRLLKQGHFCVSELIPVFEASASKHRPPGTFCHLKKQNVGQLRESDPEISNFIIAQ
jgi:hypothetical protein